MLVIVGFFSNSRQASYRHHLVIAIWRWLIIGIMHMTTINLRQPIKDDLVLPSHNVHVCLIGGLGVIRLDKCQGWVASILKFKKDWLQMYKNDDKL